MTDISSPVGADDFQKPDELVEAMVANLLDVGVPMAALPIYLERSVARIIVNTAESDEWDFCVETCCTCLREMVADAKRKHGVAPPEPVN